MNPVISNVEEENGIFYYRLSGVNISFANALRRIMLSEIPTIVFRTSPHEENKVRIHKNTTRLNNELIKQRLSCIPIHISDTSFPLDDHIVELDVTNTTGTIKYVTTKDFKIKNIKNERYLTEEATRKIFPPNPITKDWIIIARLRPKTSSLAGEALKLESKFDIGTAKQNSAFNVVATCSYGASQDPVAVNAAWTEYDKTQAQKEGEVWKDERDIAKSDWLLLDGKRHVIPNSVDFTVESVGVFSNTNIIYRACHIMLDKLKSFEATIQAEHDLIKVSDSTIENCYDITLKGEDYTLGKVLEFVLYDKHYNMASNTKSDKTVSYCGFRKPHPHIDESLIRLGFMVPREVPDVVDILVNTARDATAVFEKIASNFNETAE